ncbi:putative Antirepressor regulating drug resistance protein [Candidatus Sulfopaludibacter sp. SbA3]|nr:putative Antirepressor regulating drug resistance protein [Candidatus Sulfopaludibacter sp. SbA3]
MTGELTNHVWQSTLFAAAAGLLTLACRKNRAKVRFWLWFSASCKFFVPFALLMSLGSHVDWAPAAQKLAAPALSLTMVEISQPFTGARAPSAPGVRDWVPATILGVWACGFAAVVLLRFRGWLRVRAAMRASTRIDFAATVEVRSTPGLLEPGVVGLWRPILLLPAGIAEHLTSPQLEAVLAHELCHVRRRDNLFAAIHMIVEALFWFHPMVWWIGARLVEERERACDEEVLSLGNEPHVYAEGILNVCRLYVESPLVCVSGVTGSDLKKRIEAILANRLGQRLNRARKCLLATAGVAALTCPLLIGVRHAPAAQMQAKAPQLPAFDAASLKPGQALGGRAGSVGGGFLQFSPERGVAFSRSVTARRMILEAYHLTPHELSGGPGWLDSDWFVLDAKAETPANATQLREMLQTLLAERFKLVTHSETREIPVYAVTAAKNGPRLHAMTQGDDPAKFITRERYIELWGTRGADARAGWGGVSNMPEFLHSLSHLNSLDGANIPPIDRPVLDQTGVRGTYWFHIGWDSDEDLIPAIEEELGLKFESQKAPVDILVIDKIEKPSDN